MWHGVFPSLCTPFLHDGEPDLEAQRKVVRFGLSSGVDGLVCFGLAGEVNKLVPDERRRLADAIIEEVDGRVPVLVGVSSESLHTTLGLAQSAQTAGADGIVLAPPASASVEADHLEYFFRTVAQATPLPLILQNAPAYLGVRLTTSLVGRLTEHEPNIRYVKLEAGPEDTASWVERLPPGTHVFTGDAGIHLLTCLRAGAVGNMPGVELSDLLVEVCQTEKTGDDALADALHARLLPYLVFSLQSLDHYNACTKQMLVRRGILTNAALREPAPQLTPFSLRLLDGFATHLGFVDASRADLAAPSMKE